MVVQFKAKNVRSIARINPNTLGFDVGRCPSCRQLISSVKSQTHCRFCGADVSWSDIADAASVSADDTTGSASAAMLMFPIRKVTRKQYAAQAL